MKFWLDAQLPPGICAWLAGEFAVECGHVQDLGLREADDADLFAAVRKPESIVMTKDADFPDIVTRLQPPPQVVWLRVGNCSNATLKSFLQRALPEALRLLRAGEPVVELHRLDAE